MTPRAPSLATLALAAAAGLPGCAPAEPDVVTLDDLRVVVWQPEALAVGQGDLLDDARRLDVTLVVDGEERPFSLTDGQRRAKGLEAAAEGSTVRVVLETRGTTLPDALGRTPPVALTPGGDGVEALALLAPPAAAHKLSATVPSALTDVAACAAPDGRAWIAGGLGGGVPTTGAIRIDPSIRGVVEGPGMSARRGADCAWDGGEGVFVYGGCDAAGNGAFGLQHSATGRRGETFADVGGDALPAGCGARVRRTPQGELFLLNGAQAQVVSAAGRTTQAAPRPLGLPRYYAQVLPLAGDDVDVLIAGGVDSPAGGSPVSGALRATVAGNTLSIIPVPALDGALFDVGGAPFALLDRDVVSLDGEGAPTEVEGVASLPAGKSATAFAALGDGRFAALTDDGSEVILLSSQAISVPLSPPRPGAALLVAPGGALLLVGGGVQGTALIVAE